MILGIDSSKHKTGFAILDPKTDKLVECYVIEFNKEDGEGKHLTRIRDEIKKLITTHKPNIVAVEDLNIRFMSSARIMFLYHGAIKQVIYEYCKFEASYVVNSSWRSKLGIKTPTKDEKISKAYQIGTKKNGEPKMQEYDVKCATLKYINERMNLKLEYSENDLADAIGLVLWAKEELLAK